MVKRVTEIDKYVGKQVRRRRVEMGLSQSELGDALGLSFQQVQKYENGANRVSAGRLFEIARRFGVSFDYFFEGLGSAARVQRDADIFEGGDRQIITLVRSFSQIPDADTRTAITGFVGSIAQVSGARKIPKARRKR